MDEKCLFLALILGFIHDRRIRMKNGKSFKVAIFGSAWGGQTQKCHWKTLPLKAQKALADGRDPSLNIKSG